LYELHLLHRCAVFVLGAFGTGAGVAQRTWSQFTRSVVRESKAVVIHITNLRSAYDVTTTFRRYGILATFLPFSSK